MATTSQVVIVQTIFGAKKNAAFTLRLPFIAQGTPLIKTTPTIAAGDVKVSIDGGALANVTNLPTEAPAASGLVEIDLTAAEMNGSVIVVRGVDVAGDEWVDWTFTIVTTEVTVDSLVRSTTPANALTVDGSGKVAVGAGGIVAASFATDAVDSNAIATSGANKVRDTILSDATPFPGARVDAAVSSRADGAAFTNARAVKLDNLDATVSSRADGANYTAGRAANLDSLDVAVSSRVSSASLTPTRAANLDHLNADVSSRAVPGDAMALVASAVDASKITAAAGNKLADHVLRRKLANARASSDGDALDKRSQLGAASRLVNKVNVNGAQLEIFDETDAGTPFAKFNLVGNSSATPIVTATPAA
jgi:hypothetical protein